MTNLRGLLCFCILLGLANGEAISFCNQTPYPDLCRSLIDIDLLSKVIQNMIAYRNLALRSTVTKVEEIHRKLSLAMKSGLLEGRAKAAWSDCLYLFEDTVSLINRSIHESNFENSQTWLSAAIANQKTCENGFIELNLPNYLSSSTYFSPNVTKWISNLLAINKVSVSNNVPVKLGRNNRRLLSDKFPMWITTGDRKLLQLSSNFADLVVAQDGSGHYGTINDALNALMQMRNGDSRFVIYVKSGVYAENVEITKNMRNIMLIGDGVDSTIITGSRSVLDGITTFSTATFGVAGDGFIARDITFENTAGPERQQAVAFRSTSDCSIYYRCSFKGYQDTLYVVSQRQFYRECEIYGTVDIIFGDAAAVIQRCNILVRRPLDEQVNVITAQSRSDPNEITGISVQYSQVIPSPEFVPVQTSFRTFLGRPWQRYSATVFMQNYLGNLIHPSGWVEWDGDFGLDTLYYGEYMNIGEGSDTSHRVNWPGFRVITSDEEAEKFTVNNLLDGDSWIPGTGVPFTSRL